MSQKITLPAELTPQQILAVEKLAMGATVVATAKAIGVARETVHRWFREDWPFQAAVNASRRDMLEGAQRRMLALADKALTNVEDALDQANLAASLTLLKGIGALDGTTPRVGSDDAQILKEEAALLEKELEMARAIHRMRL